MRDAFDIIPIDKSTKHAIYEINRKNLLLVFVLSNLYFCDSW